MRVICHISKKTARYLLASGLVPSINTGKKTRQYIINKKMLSRILKSVNPNRKNSLHRLAITRQAGTKAASPKRWPYGNGQIWIPPKAERSFRTFLPWKCSPTAMCWVLPKQAGLPAITTTPWRIGAITGTSDTLKSVADIWFPNLVCWIFCSVLIFWTAIDLLKSWLTLRKNSADKVNRQKSPPPNECYREKQRPSNVKRRTLFFVVKLLTYQ